MWYAIILAGGSGSRMAADRNKVLLDLCGMPVIVRSVQAFQEIVQGIILVSRDEDIPAMQSALLHHSLTADIIRGGATRQESVLHGLEALPPDCTHVLIHDGARCLIDQDTIIRCMESAEKHGSGVAAIPAVDTMKLVDEDECVISTPDRSMLRSVQTPQAFAVKLIKDAHRHALMTGFLGTDDASLLEHMGCPVHLATGNRRNIKLTTPEDMMMAEALLSPRLPCLRVGQGYDVHRLVEGRDLILCGVQIPHSLGLLGHSDADVALHALMDAMLGAMSLGDIGKHFPDTDEQYRGISSIKLLHHVVTLLAEHNARVTNCDITIVAQKPKLLPYIAQMRDRVGQALQLPVDRVNVKATTTERLSFEGREEGISAQAICMVEQR